MASQEFYFLEGKLRRTTYAIVKTDLIEHVTTLDEAGVKTIMKGVKSAINDAVNDSLEFMWENGMIQAIPKKRKKKRGK